MTHKSNGGAPTPSGVPVKGTGGSPTPRRNSGKSSNLPSMIIFVFGSNLAGRHGRGAALSAVKHHGAIYGQGVGLQGNAYAIPTKDENLRILPLDIVKKHVEDFLEFAKAHPEMTFNVTEVGCGLAIPAGQTHEERVADIAPLFGNFYKLKNVNLPKLFLDNMLDLLDNHFLDEYEGDLSTHAVIDEVRKITGETPRDKIFIGMHKGKVTSADASVTSASTDPNLDSMVINNIEPENAVRIYHSDAEVVGANTPTIEAMECVCTMCGFCGPHTIDGYCRNQVTGPHVSQYGKRRKTMQMNDDLIYGDGDKVYFKEDQYGNGTLTSAKMHTNSKGDLIQGLNLGEKQYRRDASQAEIDKAEGVHIRKFGCPCVKCTIGGIVEEDEEGTPTGATAANPLGYGDSFVSPRNNIFQKSVTDIFLELEKYHNSKGIKGIDPEQADYMMRIENRHMIAHASIEYASPKEWMLSRSNKKYSHNGGFLTKSKTPITARHFLDNIHHYEISENCDVAWCSEMHEIRTPVYAEKSEADAPSCAPYHKMGWKLDTCSCTPREQPTTFYMNVVGGIPDKDGIVDEPITFHPERDPDSKIPARSITLLRTTFGPTTDYIPERETFDHYSYVIPTLTSFVLGDTRLGLPYVPKGTKEELDSGDPRLVGTVKAPCRCVRNRDKMQCDCKYEDLQIDKGEWNSTHVMSNDPVKGKASSLGEVERKKIWYSKWYMQSKLPTVQKLGFNICPEDDDKCDHFFCKKWYKKDNKLGPNYPKETTPWQRNFAKERGVILPDDYDYSQSFEILSYLFKTPPNTDTANEKIALHVAHVAHMKEHTSPDMIIKGLQFPSFKLCDECGAIYTHQDEGVDSETGKVTPENNSIHIITGTQYALPVPAKKFISAVKFDDTGRYIRNADLELAFVGSSKIMDWQMLPMTEIIRKAITSAKEAVGKRLVISSGGAKGVDTLAEKIAIELGVRTHIYSPDIQGWEDGVWSRELGRIERGYKTRNIMIAQHCCKLVNLVGKAPKKPKIVEGRTIKVMCKFCNLPHYSSGGCYTAKKAFWLGKDSETIAV